MATLRKTPLFAEQSTKSLLRRELSWLWLAVTVAMCSLLGVIPLDQALYRLNLPMAMRTSLNWQLGAFVVWMLASPVVVERWAQAKRELLALVALAVVSLFTAGLNALLVWTVIKPPSSYSPFVSWVELVLALLPGHAVTLGLIALVGSWTASRYQQAKAHDRELLLSSTLVRAELETLRTRLQPHFLLNALNTVAGLARDNQGQRAAEVVADLGELLRFSLAESGDDVSFDAEREIVERYLDIEQARLGSKLVVQWSLPSDMRSVRLPALMWQPLVENAIRHGVALRDTPGVLRLSAHRGAHAVCLAIDADGPSSARESVTERDASRGELGGLGMGLATVQRRLDLIYGHRARLLLHVQNGRSRTELHLPLDSA